MTVRVHRNLRTSRWVVTARGRKLSDHRELVLADCRFVVSGPRRLAVLRAHRREVHAWCVGTIGPPVPMPADARRGTYNPYRAPTFTDVETGAPLETAARVWFTTEGMFVEDL